ncbi:hypothetical protein BU26DRAFT_509657 [Trematosphaeria pertusa]|uniref:Uncharacterized protein n=1 Tax=Trematosphaeria pertusa TaxID=390896 RepID=A0A6A6I1P4_9PLEO|nr:uncharacterized protein BU26DRAFT_509657 [Trematosphaeria pertusa]KAF2243892.1 hypothetical protein BU26DRAFT_509657 [Trematosphaeria pertusa]
MPRLQLPSSFGGSRTARIVALAAVGTVSTYALVKIAKHLSRSNSPLASSLKFGLRRPHYTLDSKDRLYLADVANGKDRRSRAPRQQKSLPWYGQGMDAEYDIDLWGVKEHGVAVTTYLNALFYLAIPRSMGAPGQLSFDTAPTAAVDSNIPDKTVYSLAALKRLAIRHLQHRTPRTHQLLLGWYIEEPPTFDWQKLNFVIDLHIGMKFNIVPRGFLDAVIYNLRDIAPREPHEETPWYSRYYLPRDLGITPCSDSALKELEAEYGPLPTQIDWHPVPIPGLAARSSENKLTMAAYGRGQASMAALVRERVEKGESYHSDGFVDIEEGDDYFSYHIFQATVCEKLRKEVEAFEQKQLQLQLQQQSRAEQQPSNSSSSKSSQNRSRPSSKPSSGSSQSEQEPPTTAFDKQEPHRATAQEFHAAKALYHAHANPNHPPRPPPGFTPSQPHNHVSTAPSTPPGFPSRARGANKILFVPGLYLHEDLEEDLKKGSKARPLTLQRYRLLDRGGYFQKATKPSLETRIRRRLQARVVTYRR